MADARTSGTPLMHPLLGLALLQPQLLIDHASACADLMLAEADVAAAQWRRQALWAALAGAGFVLAFSLAGTGLMLWATLPEGSLARPPWLWALAAVPLLPLLLGLLALQAARRRAPPAFGLLRRQLAQDLDLLRDPNPPPGQGAVR
jgi:hypothetical protein